MKFLCPELPWLDRMGIVFLLCCGLIILLGSSKHMNEEYTTHRPGLFRTSRLFNVMSLIVIAILVTFYCLWW